MMKYFNAELQEGLRGVSPENRWFLDPLSGDEALNQI